MKRSITMMKIGVFLGLLAETYLNAALPSLMVHFNVPAEKLQWLTSLYILTMGLSVPISAFLIHRTTAKELFLGAITLFLVGTVLGGFAPSFSVLLIARIIQAAGASMTLPLMIHSIMATYEKGEQGKAMGSAMLVILFAPAIGPSVGALILELLSWRWIFLSTAALLLALLIWSSYSMEQTTEKEVIKVDFLSIALSIIGFGALVYGLQQLLSGQTSSTIAIILTLIGIAGIWWFVLRQKTLTNPMLSLVPLSQPTFALGAFLIIVTHLVVFGSFIMLPMYLVQTFNTSSLFAGLALLPGGFIGAAAPTLAGRIYDRRGPKHIVLLGFFLLITANFLFSLTHYHQSPLFIILIYMLLMAGFGVTLTPLQTHSLSQLEKTQLGSGTAILNTAMLIASSMGGSLFIALFAAKSAKATFEGGVAHAYTVTAAVACVGLLGALFFAKKE